MLYTLCLYTLYLDLLTLPPFKIHKRLSSSDQPTAPLRFTQVWIKSKPKNTHICQKPKRFTDISVRYFLPPYPATSPEGSIEVQLGTGSVETKSGAHFCVFGGVENDDH